MNTTCSWSGGKDSCFALIQSLKLGMKPQVLLNVLNEEGKISRSHGIPLEILQAQANVCDLPLHAISSSWANYEPNFVDALTYLKEKYSLKYAVFGDIDLQEHRDWEEMVCKKAGLAATLPLWKRNRKELVEEMLNNNMEACIVSCNTAMGEQFIGQKLTFDLIEQLEHLGIDPCGENGEYHTLVTNCTLFKAPIKVEVIKSIFHNNYWFSNLKLV